MPTITEIADTLEPRPYSSREFIWENWQMVLSKNSVKKDSLIQTCFEYNVPIFVACFLRLQCGFGLVMHQLERIKEGKPYLQ
jgi:deoxyhypusine synthase